MGLSTSERQMKNPTDYFSRKITIIIENYRGMITVPREFRKKRNIDDNLLNLIKNS